MTFFSIKPKTLMGLLALILTVAQPEVSFALEENKAEVIGLELIYTSPSTANAESFFGHMALRLVRNHKHPLRDDVISPSAIIPEGEPLDYEKAINGGYPIGANQTSYKQYLERYIGEYKRYFYRIILPSTAEQRKKLLDAHESNIYATMGSYKYFSNNCATAVTKLLKAAGFPIQDLPVLPNQIENLFFTLGLKHYPGLVVQYKESEREMVERIIDTKELQKLSKAQLYRAFFFNRNHFRELLSKKDFFDISKSLRSTREERLGYLGEQYIPRKYYELSLSQMGIRNASDLFSHEEIESHCAQIKQLLTRRPYSLDKKIKDIYYNQLITACGAKGKLRLIL